MTIDANSQFISSPPFIDSTQYMYIGCLFFVPYTDRNKTKWLLGHEGYGVMVESAHNVYSGKPDSVGATHTPPQVMMPRPIYPTLASGTLRKVISSVGRRGRLSSLFLLLLIIFLSFLSSSYLIIAFAISSPPSPSLSSSS